MKKYEGLPREIIALRVSREIKDGSYVNLGIGIPTLVSNWLEGRDVILQSEIGMLKTGSLAEGSDIDQDLINASCQPVTELPGSVYFDISESFAMIRGGHVDTTVMGAFQVNARGDFAGWFNPSRGLVGVGNVGGSMDLAVGARKLFIAMEHTTNDGQPKIVSELTYPATARNKVQKIFTDLAVIEVVPEGLLLKEIYPGLTPDDLQSVTEPVLLIAPDLVEALAYSGTGAWWLVAFTASIPACVVTFGSKAQKQSYLRPVVEGSMIPSIQFTEPETGSDPKAITTTLVPEEDHYLITGAKRFSTFANRKGYALVYGKDDTDQISAFIVPKFLTGYSVGKAFELMGSGGIESCDVYYDGVRISSANLLGKKGRGMEILLRWIADEKIQQCAACVGLAQAALDEAIGFSKTRKIRKKVQADLQGIRWMVADMYSQLEAARWLTYRTAFLKGTDSPGWMTQAAATKNFVVPAVLNIVDISRRIHGSYGYTREFKIERLYRAAAGASVIAVSNEINKSIVGAALVN